MSILIKGMEMPECCGYCPFEYKNYCMAKPSLAVESADRHPRCPLVPVPAHGRLGDLDALRKRIEENIDAAKKAGNHEWWYSCTVALDFALAAPTVIDAEEKAP